MRVVVGGVILAVGGVQFVEPGDGCLDRGVRRKIQHERPDLRAQEVVWAACAQRTEAHVLGRCEEVGDDRVIGEMPDLRAVCRDEATDVGGQGRGLREAPLGGQCRVAVELTTERVGLTVGRDELLSSCDDPQAVGLHLVARVAPGGDSVSAEDAADRLRIRGLDGSNVEPELESGAAPRHPHDPLTEGSGRQGLTVGGGGERNAGVRMQVVDMGGIHQGVHGRVDGGGRATLAVQRVVEGGDHLVLAIESGVDVDQGAQAVDSQHSKTRFGERAEVTARAFHPEQFDRLACDGVDLGALGTRVAARVVRDPRVRAEPV